MAEPRAYYNEIDPEAVAALHQLIADDVIMSGDVDSRSIKEVTPDDVRGYTQCHFFAGAGLWSVAARRAGWPDRRPIWSGSCPCQGESLAGKRRGADDPRHLWPDFFRLIRAERPAVIVGEQVAAAAGTHWLDGTCADLESELYAARTVNIPACAVDAPHIRQRLYWLAVADAARIGIESGRPALRTGRNAAENRDDRLVADTDFAELRYKPPTRQLAQLEQDAGTGAGHVNVADAESQADFGAKRNGSYWADAEWIDCHDGKARRAKPGIRMLVDGMAGRIGLWRLAGNSIVPELAAEVLAAFLEEEADQHFRLSLQGGVFA